MTHLTEQIRKDAGRYDTILTTLFDNYVNITDVDDTLQLEKKIEMTLINMSGRVNQRCYEVYKEIYYSIKNVRTYDG